jgi:hypothetical protein
VIPDDSTPPPTITTVCGNLTSIQRKDGLFGIVKGISSADLLRDETTPQYVAFNWLVEDDLAQVCPWEALDVEQRYILSLLYFSTNGDEWLSCNRPSAPVLSPCNDGSRYLSADDVCSWMGEASINCESHGAVRILGIGKCLHCFTGAHDVMNCSILSISCF